MSISVSVEVPESALSVLRTSPAEFGSELVRAAVCKWYELGVLSQGKGAEILGVSRAEFLETLSRYRVTPFQVDEEDLSAGIERV